jgi:hypothetical protein
MSILPQLINNQGTLSSALGKSLAKKALSGKKDILAEAVTLINHESKNVRAGAAKIIEQVAMKSPEMVAPYLSQLRSGLQKEEAQTRWMIIHTYGLCARENPAQAAEVFPYAEQYMAAESGACLWGGAIKYLGFYGATGASQAQQAFPLLAKALQDLPNHSRQILTALIDLAEKADDELKEKIKDLVQPWADSDSASTSREARKLLKRI